jgi:glutamate-ammonia-ligase adenylyltransferase
MEAYRARTDEVQRLSRDILDRLTTEGHTAADPFRLMILSLAPGSGVQEGQPVSESRSAALAGRLSAEGFRHPGNAVERLRALATGAPRFSLPISTTRLFADLAPALLSTAGASPDPDAALAAVAEVAARLGTHRAFYQTLQTQPGMLRALCAVVGFSPFVREMVLRSPELLDVLYDEPFHEAPRSAADMQAEMEARLERAFSPADRLAALRRFQKRELLRIIARDLMMDVEAETTLGELSDLADSSVRGALHVAAPSDEIRSMSLTPLPSHSLTPPSPAGFAAFALGRLGGREMHYLSDLDLLYVYETPPGSDVSHREYEALAGALTRALQEWLREGQLYPVDLRLRPEGKSGFVVVHLDAARRYYLGGRAQTWERQALTRLRPVAGDPEIAARFLEVANAFVYGSPLPPEAEAEMRAMKRRIERERVSPEERDWHLKLGPGGLSDIEFLIQCLQLLHGAARPALRATGTLDVLQAAVNESLLPAGEAEDLRTAFLFLTRLRQHLRLRSAGTPTDLLPAEPDELETLALSLDLSSTADLQERFRSTTARVRDLFTRYFLSR